ncbi:unnamed protein product [Caenorhabditis bovis]|uniref:Galectin n=1 Tax=Caenorhabditis bovis TaxID=2654633 RepID=A0A8S1EZN2_9PELO|nr:unnamed protein product [Caenorhabditis bovis]
MLFLFLLAIFFNITNSSKYTDEFIFDVELTCNLRNRAFWTFSVQFFDRDSFLNPDDSVGPEIHHAHRPGTAKFRITGSQTEDEFFNYNYEIYAKIFHDCTESHQSVQLIINITPLCQHYRDCHYKLQANLENSWGIVGRRIFLNMTDDNDYRKYVHCI